MKEPPNPSLWLSLIDKCIKNGIEARRNGNFALRNFWAARYRFFKKMLILDLEEQKKTALVPVVPL